MVNVLSPPFFSLCIHVTARETNAFESCDLGAWLSVFILIKCFCALQCPSDTSALALFHFLTPEAVRRT